MLLQFVFAMTAIIVQSTSPTTSQRDQPSSQTRDRISQSIQKEVMSLSNYGVFDWITFNVDGYNVILKGYASRPTLKDSAERVTKKIEGVSAVENRIDVLPLSRMDDRVRAEAYVRIYGNSTLSRYNPNRGTPIFISPARIAAGITQDPPIGNHPIHIIVRNGNITLTGVVLNEGDKNIAGMMANQVQGAFGVDNQLDVETRK